MSPIPTVPAAWSDVLSRLRAHIAEQGWHTARTVVLVPYAQLMGIARRHWADGAASGFVPRFETTRSWARATVGFVPGADDLAFDRGRDLLTAQSLLARAGHGRERHALAGRLVDLALQLASVAAAHPPTAGEGSRSGWARRAALAVQGETASDWFQTETMLASLAITWAAHSAYATDVLLGDTALAGTDGLVLLQGLSADPLLAALQAHWGERALALPLQADAVAPSAPVCLHQAEDGEDEAERALACVLRRLEQGRAPVALVATDRALTRRIGAQLAAHGVAQQDETGWKLSTTRAAAALMTALAAVARDPGSDAMLDWLKHVPAAAEWVDQLEARLRREGLHAWPQWCTWITHAASRSGAGADAVLAARTEEVEGWRAPWDAPRPLGDWLAALRTLLQQTGQWAVLAGDAAGTEVLRALWLDDPAPVADGGRHSLADFTQWARDVLEAASFVPPGDGRAAEVVVLPLHQLLGRVFGAVVVPGCDERRLPAMPDPPGPWTPAQRRAIGLPTRELLAAQQRAAFTLAAASPGCELLVRHGDGAEPLRTSPLVQALRFGAGLCDGEDPRGERLVPATPVAPPQPVGALLPLARISASTYEDLRRCPYRFHALRLLGLRDADEISDEVDKRQFGNWVHEVLRRFHEALQATPAADGAARRALMARAEDEARSAQGLDDAGFLPFSAAWPAMREGYLAWLVTHGAQGHVFVQAEPEKQSPLPGMASVTLVGRLDRIDRGPQGEPLVLDYKTEALERSRERVKDPTEDTQLAFYAALLGDEAARAGYLNIGERGTTSLVEQPALQTARDALLGGLVDDLARIAAGAALPALGEGAVCDHCAARGLCRKDFWQQAPAGGTP